MQSLLPSQIRQDGGTQPRAAILLATVDEYAEQMTAGAEFPPIVVFYDGTHYWLADGFHRLRAWIKAHADEIIECDVRQGTQADAQWYSLSVNDKHGLPRSNVDKQIIVRRALGHVNGANLSNRQIAAHVHVDDKTVARIRREMEATAEIPQSDKRTGRDGRTTNTAGINKSRKAHDKRMNVKPQRPKGQLAREAFLPVREAVPQERITTVTLPHNPALAAGTLFRQFDAAFLRELALEINRLLAA